MIPKRVLTCLRVASSFPFALLAASDRGPDRDSRAPANAPVADESAVSESASNDAALLPACLGERLSGRLVKGLPFAALAVGGGATPSTGAFLLDWGTTVSAIDLLAFTPSAPFASGCDPTYLGERC